MVSRKVISSVVLLSVLATAPAFAQGQRRRGDSERRDGQTQAQREDSGRAERSDRAVPRSRAGGRVDDGRREQAQQAQQAQAQRQYRAEQAQRQARAEQSQRQYQARQYRNDRRDDWRRNDNVRRSYTRPYYSRGYRTVIVPRFISPRYVTGVPYRPYIYRPSIGLGIYYGSGGSYPYGYTPRGYYDPIAGRAYGGLRITGASRIAQVFADGYYVGIVNDFDGVFQHLNLEAGPHQIEIREPGLEPIAFDVIVQPGRTLTFRVDEYSY